MQRFFIKYFRLITLAYVCMLSSVNAVDFHYEFENVYSANADQYLISQANMLKVYEPNYGVTYWCPAASTGQGELIYRFDFPVASNNINLKFRLSAFNIDPYSGDASVFGSLDGSSYNLISHLSTPSSSSNDVFFNASIGNEFLGQNKLFLKVQLNVVNSHQMAQFLRSDGLPQFDYRPWFSEIPIFSITVNNAIAVPEQSSVILLSTAFVMKLIISAKIYPFRAQLKSNRS